MATNHQKQARATAMTHHPKRARRRGPGWRVQPDDGQRQDGDDGHRIGAAHEGDRHPRAAAARRGEPPREPTPRG